MTQVHYATPVDVDQHPWRVYVDPRRNTHELEYDEAHVVAREMAERGWCSRVHFGDQIVARFRPASRDTRTMYDSFAADVIAQFADPETPDDLAIDFSASRSWMEKLRAALRARGYASDIEERHTELPGGTYETFVITNIRKGRKS